MIVTVLKKYLLIAISGYNWGEKQKSFSVNLLTLLACLSPSLPILCMRERVSQETFLRWGSYCTGLWKKSWGQVARKVQPIYSQPRLVMPGWCLTKQSLFTHNPVVPFLRFPERAASNIITWRVADLSGVHSENWFYATALLRVFLHTSDKH